MEGELLMGLMVSSNNNTEKTPEFYKTVEEYPRNVLVACSLAATFNFSVTGDENTMSFIFRDSNYEFKIKFQMTSWRDYNDLEAFIDHLNWLDGCRKEELRKQEVRKNALGKLTSEERTLLGL